MSETNNNNNNIIELLSDDSDNEDDKKPAAVATTKRANMLCQFFPKKDPVPLAATTAAKRKQETPKRLAMMNGFSDMTPTPQPIFILRDPFSSSSSSTSGFKGYDLELTGPPEAWSRPSFMAWFGEDGRWHSLPVLVLLKNWFRSALPFEPGDAGWAVVAFVFLFPLAW